MEKEKFDQMMLDAPIPGESLVASPEEQKPWERPPEYTDYDKAQEFLFESIMERTDEVIDLIGNGIPLSFLATATVMSGIAKGKWNPDLMLLLIEPALYILIFVSEQAGIDYVLDFDEEFEQLDPETRLEAENYISKVVPQVLKDVEAKLGDADIEEVLPPSLLDKVEPQEQLTPEQGVEQ